MGPKLPRVTATQILRALFRDGWNEARRGGSHAVLVHSRKAGIVVVPLHAGKNLPTGTIHTIAKTAGLTAEELRRLL